jgi:hypothetical protein
MFILLSDSLDFGVISILNCFWFQVSPSIKHPSPNSFWFQVTNNIFNKKSIENRYNKAKLFKSYVQI